MLATAAIIALTLSMPALTYREGVVAVEAAVVRTLDGRAELRTGDDSVIHLDLHTALDFAWRPRLVDGRVFVRTTAHSRIEVDTPLGRVRLMPAGAYGLVLDAARRRLLLSVAVGSATLDTAYGVTTVPARAMTMVTGATAIPFVTPFDPTRWDPFELWSDSRMLQLAYGAASPWTPAQLARLGLVVDRPKAASLTCSSWLALDNPCWVVGTVTPQASRPSSPQAPKPSSPPR